MTRSDLTTLQAGKVALRDLLSEQDFSAKELAEESGIALSTVVRFIKRHEKTGEVLCVSKTLRITEGPSVGTVAARYIWETDTREAQAESLISQMLDRLLDVPLDRSGINLVKDAQRFLGWNAL